MAERQQAASDKRAKASPQEITKIIMNPTRMRIIQQLSLTPEATTAELGRRLSDVPVATLYRHMKILEEAGFLEVIQENRVRGAVEKVYKLNPQPIFPDEDKEQGSQLIHSALLALLARFDRYFLTPEADPRRDGVGLSTSTLLLTDEELNDFLGKIGQIFSEVIHHQPAPGRRPRRITLVTMPGEEEES